MADPDRPVFFYDLGSPYAYLAAERVNALFAETCGEPPGMESWWKTASGCARASRPTT